MLRVLPREYGDSIGTWGARFWLVNIWYDLAHNARRFAAAHAHARARNVETRPTLPSLPGGGSALAKSSPSQSELGLLMLKGAADTVHCFSNLPSGEKIPSYVVALCALTSAFIGITRSWDKTRSALTRKASLA